MNEFAIFLDTNTLINFLLGENLEMKLVENKSIFISEITEMEIQCQPDFNSTQRKELKRFLSTLTIVRLNNEIRETAIKIRLSTKMKLMDAIIASSSQISNIPLVTCDTKFESVKTAQIILLPSIKNRKS
ncbi:MAG: PIN domain-containing protein [Cytophagaceae bacterium]|nr:PIN domain-containing protein [Cytophagaceae bacterium]MBK9511307.1 PIN domain-containing protein [Cytophagaceae bacterium]MBK9932757.1 PIN domain-containing protein [Cytophagaceae bacterium]MBL0303554.1 PIN domain-containing protein [Cytophagaceae bacterium]MBL0326382.1 PIN domain-containing protein [Cytophagaceae bacterium]